jgi:hypothetical protein
VLENVRRLQLRKLRTPVRMSVALKKNTSVDSFECSWKENSIEWFVSEMPCQLRNAWHSSAGIIED